ncbi:MAG: hypothetical protein FWC94_06680 [Bacteroidales bacterium]|nr:hypothetical protein [Bacteroidales bacterium]
MKTIYIKAIIFLAVIALSSCATIITRSSYPINISSTPSNARVTITDNRGVTVFAGNTPALVNLSASAGFFQRAEYQIRFSNPGYDDRIISIRATVDGWYFANILFGGLIGMLIVDPATGAMWRINTTFIHETLNRSAMSFSQELRIVDIAEIPESWKEHLVEIK